MAAKKRAAPEGFASGSLLRGAVGFCLGPGRPAVVVLLVLGALAGGWYAVWHWAGVGRRVQGSPEYVLCAPGDLEITPLPPWIHTDIRAQVFRDAGLDGPLSILDDRLVERMRSVFALHPWVAKVRDVRKSYPARVKVELDYRRPVCMVEVPRGLYPVDVEGAWLPVADFSPVEASQYPRLARIDTVPVGTVGTRWGDARVVGGAEIGAALGAAWAALQLREIRPADSADAASGERCNYELFTRSGTRILWGRAPGSSPPGEVPAADKVARLVHYAEEHGSLDAAQEIDVRGPQTLQVTPRSR